MTRLEDWNAMPPQVAADAVLPCCGSKAWSEGLVARRPLRTLPEVLAASDAVWWLLAEADWQEAFESHPRIGESQSQTHATAASLQWSNAEQSSVAASDEDVKARLAAGNKAYEQTFGRIFIVCATGKSSKDILTILEQRMRNTPEVELHEAAEQQRQITHLRLQKWLAAKQQEQPQ